MFVYKVHSAKGFKEGFTDIINAFLIINNKCFLKTIQQPRKMSNKFENLPTQLK